MARLPYVDPERAPQPVREAFAQLAVPLNVFRIMAHAETCFRPLLRLGASILRRQALDARLRELAILRVAQRSGAEYEWVQHVPIALAAGATPAQVDALRRGAIDADRFGSIERLVLRFTDEMMTQVRASDALFAELERELGPREIVELILAIGYYMMLARLLESTAVDLEPAAGTRIVDSIDG